MTTEPATPTGPTERRSLPYIAGLDGLRGLGMFAVLVYHARLGVSGAALAVSQFFTFSGYLITSLVLRRRSFHSAADVLPFWARRYRRLAPAALLTVAGVVLFGATVATEQQLGALPGTVIAALAQVANWHFIVSDISYVEIFNAPSPLQHFWSLAIEEQFYLTLPLVLLVGFRLTSSLKVITGAFVAAVLASSGAMYMMFGNGVSIDRLYYGTDTRAAEILVGCVLALVLEQRPLQLNDRGRRVLGGLGLAAAIATYWMWFNVSLTDSALYRGGFLLHALLTAVLIVTMTDGAGPVVRIFSIRPLALLGRLSYTVYCFHWPVYLWLDADRVGIDRWGLWLVRVGVTLALSVVSLRLIETPIRTRRFDLSGIALPLTYLGISVLLIGGVVLAGTRDVRTDLAGLDGDTGSEPPPVVTEDGPFRLLVVPDAEGIASAADLQTAAGDQFDVEIAPTFGCEPSSPTSTACDSFRADWSGFIDDFDPDVVLFLVTYWETADIEEKSGLTGNAALRQWTREQLGTAVDVLSERGATVVHGNVNVTIADAVARNNAPFPLALRDLVNSDSRVRQIGWVVDSGAALDQLQALSTRGKDDARRVLVLGDSVAKNIGYGLSLWADATDAAVVWSAATPGCGVADDGFLSDPAGREIEIRDECHDAVAAWSDQLESFRPDVVVITSGETDFQRRRLPEWDEMLAPGDAAFDDYLVAEYVAATDTLGSGGAEVVWIRPACADNPAGIFVEPDGRSAFDIDRIEYVNETIFGRLGEARPTARQFDLFEVLCPDGRFEKDIGLEDLRPDGVHFSPEGAVWLAENYGEELLGRADG